MVLTGTAAFPLGCSYLNGTVFETVLFTVRGSFFKELVAPLPSEQDGAGVVGLLGHEVSMFHLCRTCGI